MSDPMSDPTPAPASPSIDPRTGLPVEPRSDRAATRSARSRLASVPLISAALRLPASVQKLMWVAVCALVALVEVEAIVAVLETLTLAPMQRAAALLAAVFVVCAWPVLISRRPMHLLRPVTVTALCLVVDPAFVAAVLLVGVTRVLLGEVATTSLWPRTQPRRGVDV